MGDEAGRRVFLEVRDTAGLVDDLESGRGLFVPTRLPLALNNLFILAIRLRNASRSVELPMIVVGRRVPRGGSILSAGVVAKLADPDSPMFELLREVASGRVVDLESRIQEQQRIPVRARFASTAEAMVELRALAEGAAHFPLEQLVARGDRLALTAESADGGALVSVHVLVKSVSLVDGRRSAAVELLDDKARAQLAQFLARGRASARA